MAMVDVAPIDELTGQPTSSLEAQVRGLAAEIAAATCRFLLLVGELDRRGAWRYWECRSCAHWLSWQCGISLSTGYEHVRVGRALADLPEVSAAFSSGRLSYSKVRALTRVATPESERVLVDLALEATAAHLDRIVGGYQRAVKLADPDRASVQLRRRAVWSEANDDGTRTIHARLTPDAAALVESAIEAALAGVPELIDRPDAPSSARRADALAVIAQEYLAPSVTDGPTTDMVVHVDVETLVADRPGRSEVERGDRLGTETARRLACDARLTVSLEERGTTLDVGRRTRTVSPSLRRALLDRDQSRCRFPGCTNTRQLHAHHRWHWARGGPTSRENLLLVCRYHHRALHEGGWIIEGDLARHLTFVGPNGQRIPEVALPAAHTDPDALRRARVRSGAILPRDAGRARWKGEALDLDLAITAMACLDQLHPPDEPDRTDGHD